MAIGLNLTKSSPTSPTLGLYTSILGSSSNSFIILEIILLKFFFKGSSNDSLHIRTLLKRSPYITPTMDFLTRSRFIPSNEFVLSTPARLRDKTGRSSYPASFNAFSSTLV